MSIAPEQSTVPTTIALQDNKDQRSRQSTMPSGTKAYRLHFSCNHTGRYRRHTKRQIQWRFGFTDMSAVREGKRGSECRGEEHEVTLVWSVKSGKTRVFWNKSNISHLFKSRNLFDSVSFEWQSRAGEKFQILASEDPIQTKPQYDFLIDGVSFFALPHVSEIGNEDANMFHNDVASSVSGSHPTLGDVRSGDSLGVGNQDPSDDLSFRLKMAGFSNSNVGAEREVQDELTSELYSSTLESLRHTVTACIPEAEEMVSRAIINAFSDDRDSQNSLDSSSFDSEMPNPFQIQVDVLADTYEWINLNVDYAPRPDVEDQKLSFMQKQVEAMFSHVRHERLGADEAARILVNVAVVLGMTLKIPVPKDTVVLTDLPKEVAAEDLVDSLCGFGEVCAVGIAKRRQFGVCRFLSEVGPSRVIVASEAGTLSIGGSKPSAWLLSSPIPRRPHFSRALSVPNQNLARPMIAVRQRSHQRNTMSIETLFQGSVALGAHICISDEDEPAVITPDATRSVLRPNVFSNIPARTDHPMYAPSSIRALDRPQLVSPDRSWYAPSSMKVHD